MTADIDLSCHQFDLGLNYKSLALGARLQLTRIAPVASPAVTETTLGGFVGIAL